MNKIKIIHIHTDLKFVYDSRKFVGEEFENIIIIIGNKNQYNGPYKESAQFYKQSFLSMKAIIEHCKMADIVVVYNLCWFKAYIVNRLPSSVKVIWRFFGAELYSKMAHYVFSQQTNNLKSRDKNYELISKFKTFLRSIYFFFYSGFNFNREFENAAFKRVNFFYALSKKEYLFLKKNGYNLPNFLQISFEPYNHIKRVKKNNSNLILVGNNKSTYNNHIDIIEIIKNSIKKYDYEFLFIFSYGQNNSYTTAVKEKITNLKNIKLLEDFLTTEKFEYLYLNATAFVMNGYRQMAMGNVFNAIRNNTKLYLNDKNMTLSWLKEEGFIIFSINDFISDLDNQSIELTEMEAIHNQKQLIKFTDKYNIAEFHESIKKIVNGKY